MNIRKKTTNRINVSNEQIRQEVRDILGPKPNHGTWLKLSLLCLLCIVIAAVILLTSSAVATYIFRGSEIPKFFTSFILPIATWLILTPLYCDLLDAILGAVREGVISFVSTGTNYDRWRDICALFIRQCLRPLLLGLLLLFPGVIKAYAYAMAPFITLDHPDYDWKTCLRESKRMMKGNKKQLFNLQFKTLGWGLLAALVPFVGPACWLAYVLALTSRFYVYVSTNNIEQSVKGQ